MEKFSSIWKRAAKRKGGDAALEALLPEIKTPAQLKKIPDDRWLAGMSKRIFQAGFVWKVIESKWEGFEVAFENFDPARIAQWSEGEIGRLLGDTRIVRNPQKIRAVHQNAAMMVRLAGKHGSAAAFFADWPGTDFVGLLDLLKQEGSRLGGFTGAAFFRYMGKDAFIINDDVTAALVAAGVVERTAKSKRDLTAVQAAFNAWVEESGRPLAHISRTLACSVDD